MAINELFLKQFPAEIRPHIIEYGKRLGQIDADVLIFMARKSACFFRCLEALQMTTVRVAVTSDRVLDHDLSWLRGRRVALIDEALISGTTLHFATAALRKAGAASVQTHVLLVNVDWWVPELIQPEPGYLQLGDGAASTVSEAIVTAMSLLPRPYTVDFPLLSRSATRGHELRLLDVLPGWHTYDVTTPLQRTHGVLSRTTEPDTRTLEKLDQRVGWPLSQSSIMKIRVYGRLTPDGSRFEFRALPIAMLYPLQRSTIDALFDAIADIADDAAHDLRRSCVTGIAKLRVIQYWLASKLSAVWLDTLNPFLAAPISGSHDSNELRLLFPPSIAATVGKIAQTDEPIRPNIVGAAHAIRPELRKPRTAKANLFQIQVALTKPFVQMYEQRELPARGLVKKLGIQAFDNPDYRLILDRLKRGISIPELLNVIPPVSSLNRKRLLSAFLDFAIDRGIVVPIVVEEKGTSDSRDLFYRAFRHGEEITVTERELRIIAVMFRQFFEECAESHVSAILAEKALVLFVQMGYRDGIFTGHHGQFGAPNTIGVRYYLHGAVIQHGSKRLTDFRPEGSFTSLLVDEGILHRGESGRRYGFGKVPDSFSDKNKEDRAWLIARAIGAATETLRRGRRRREVDRDLMLIATCRRPQDALTALAAEVNIFIEYWATARRHFVGSRSPRKERFVEQFRKSKGFVSVTSGLIKFTQYNNGTPDALIAEAFESLSSRDRTLAVFWRQLWPQPETYGSVADLQMVHTHIADAGAWLSKVQTLLLIWEFLVRSADPTASSYAPALSDEVERALADVVVQAPESNITQLWARVNDKNAEQDAVLDATIAGLDAQIGLGEETLQFVESVITPFGRLRNVLYCAHVLIVRIDINTLTDAEVKQLDSELFADISRTQARIKKSAIPKRYDQAARMKLDGGDLDLENHMLAQVQVPAPDGETAVTYAIAARGERSPVWLAHLASRVMKICGSRGIVSSHLFLDLPKRRQLYYVEGDTQIKNEYFWELARAALSQFPGSARAPFLAYGHNNDTLDRVQKQLETEFKQNTTRLTLGRHVLRTEVPHTVTVTGFQPSIPISNQHLRRRPMHVAIVSIVTDEMRALKGWLTKHGPIKEEEGESSSRIFLKGTTRGRDGMLDVIATQSQRQGNRSIIHAVESIFQECNPRIVILVGIGARLNDKVDIGDVILADGVYYVDDRVEHEVDGVQRRLEAYPPPPWSTSRMQQFFNQHGDPAKFDSMAFKTVPAQIAASEILLRDRSHPIRAYMENITDKIYAIDKEAGGFASYFHDKQQTKGYKPLGYFVFRGISDDGDPDKHDSPERRAACANAFLAVEKMLETLMF